jgi:hypothetical protein
MGKHRRQAKVSGSTDTESDSEISPTPSGESNQELLQRLGPFLRLVDSEDDLDLENDQPNTSTEEDPDEWEPPKDLGEYMRGLLVSEEDDDLLGNSEDDELSDDFVEPPMWIQEIDELGLEEQIDDDIGDEEWIKPRWTRKSKGKGEWDQIETERDRVSKVRTQREKKKGLWGLGLGRKEKKLKKKALGKLPELAENEIAAIATAGWPADPFALDFGTRLVDGPGLSQVELAAVETLSGGEGGQLWLSCAGMLTLERAMTYLHASQYFDWLTLEPATRVELASIAYVEGIGRDPESPAYSLGRHYMLRTDDVMDRVEAEIDRDIQIRSMFQRTMTPGENTPETEYAIRHGATSQTSKSSKEVLKQNNQAIEILERIFLLLQSGLQVYDDEVGDHVDLEGVEVCRALAHGGRVNVRIPAITGDQTGRELPEWLGLLDGGPVFTRMFGTHHITIGKDDKFVEDGGAKCNLRNIGDGASLFGMDLSGGGFGNLDHNGDLILPDGAHGHMFFSFNPPQKDRDGGLQIGIETTRPGAPSLVGYHHGPESTELTANPESTFGGHKTDKIGDGSPRQLGKKKKHTSWKETNGRYLDLNQVGDGNWEQYLEKLRTQWYEPMKEESPQKALSTLLGPRTAPS